MMEEPELTDDAVIELAREGGVAFIPRLSAPRRIVVAQLSAAQRLRILDILQQTLPVGQPPGQPDSPGRGDRRFFRLHIVWTTRHPDMLVLIPEEKAPAALVTLWREGESCIEGD